MSSPKKIEKVFIFVSTDDEGNEGIVAFNSSGGWVPMVGADMERVKMLIPVADAIKQQTGKDYEIRYFVPASSMQ